MQQFEIEARGPDTLPEDGPSMSTRRTSNTWLVVFAVIFGVTFAVGLAAMSQGIAIGSSPLSTDSPRFHISDFLETTFLKSKLPDEILGKLAELKYTVVLESVKRVKVSFLVTYQLSVTMGMSEAIFPIVVQIIGAEMGEMVVVDTSIHHSAARLAHAAELAAKAGVLVPKVLGTGQLFRDCGEVKQDSFDFVLFEHIQTLTREDRVVAPREEWDRIRNGVWDKLVSFPVSAAEAEPLPFFASSKAFMLYLQGLTSDSEVSQALFRVEEELHLAETAAKDRSGGASQTGAAHWGHCPDMSALTILTNSKVNDGNMLCSPDDAGKNGWRLDAVINWDSAAVVSCSIFSNHTSAYYLRHLAHVAKGSWLKERIAAGQPAILPRMEYNELMGEYQNSREVLEAAGVLKATARRMTSSRDLRQSALGGGRRRHF